MQTTHSGAKWSRCCSGLCACLPLRAARCHAAAAVPGPGRATDLLQEAAPSQQPHSPTDRPTDRPRSERTGRAGSGQLALRCAAPRRPLDGAAASPPSSGPARAGFPYVPTRLRRRRLPPPPPRSSCPCSNPGRPAGWRRSKSSRKERVEAVEDRRTMLDVSRAHKSPSFWPQTDTDTTLPYFKFYHQECLVCGQYCGVGGGAVPRGPERGGGGSWRIAFLLPSACSGQGDSSPSPFAARTPPGGGG